MGRYPKKVLKKKYKSWNEADKSKRLIKLCWGVELWRNELTLIQYTVSKLSDTSRKYRGAMYIAVREWLSKLHVEKSWDCSSNVVRVERRAKAT